MSSNTAGGMPSEAAAGKPVNGPVPTVRRKAFAPMYFLARVLRRRTPQANHVPAPNRPPARTGRLPSPPQQVTLRQFAKATKPKGNGDAAIAVSGGDHRICFVREGD